MVGGAVGDADQHNLALTCAWCGAPAAWCLEGWGGGAVLDTVAVCGAHRPQGDAYFVLSEVCFDWVDTVKPEHRRVGELVESAGLSAEDSQRVRTILMTLLKIKFKDARPGARSAELVELLLQLRGLL